MSEGFNLQAHRDDTRVSLSTKISGPKLPLQAFFSVLRALVTPTSRASASGLCTCLFHPRRTAMTRKKSEHGDLLCCDVRLTIPSLPDYQAPSAPFLQCVHRGRQMSTDALCTNFSYTPLGPGFPSETPGIFARKCLLSSSVTSFQTPTASHGRPSGQSRDSKAQSLCSSVLAPYANYAAHAGGGGGWAGAQTQCMLCQIKAKVSGLLRSWLESAV